MGINPVTAMALARLRGVAALTLSGSCLIEQESATVNELGGRSHAWAVVGEDVACRLIKVGRETGSQVVESGEREKLPEKYRLIVPYGTTLGVNYRVTVDELVYAVVQLESALTDKAFVSAIIVRSDKDG